MNTREMLNEDTRNLERKGETCRVRRRRWGAGGWTAESRQLRSHGGRRKKSPLLKKTKCFHTGCKCIRLSKSKGRCGGCRRKEMGWGGRRMVGPRTVSMVTTQMAIPDILTALCMCVMLETRGWGWGIFWGRDREGGPRAI